MKKLVLVIGIIVAVISITTVRVQGSGKVPTNLAVANR